MFKRAYIPRDCFGELSGAESTEVKELRVGTRQRKDMYTDGPVLGMLVTATERLPLRAEWVRCGVSMQWNTTEL